MEGGRWDETVKNDVIIRMPVAVPRQLWTGEHTSPLPKPGMAGRERGREGGRERDGGGKEREGERMREKTGQPDDISCISTSHNRSPVATVATFPFKL